MLINGENSESKVYEEIGSEVMVTDGKTTEDQQMLDLYEKIAVSTPGTRDAEIFAKIREWTFGDHAMKPHKYVGITRKELGAWQKRHRINLSSGHIRPAAIDLDRGHAWGTIRRGNHVNRLHVFPGPPSADELAHDLSGFSR